MNKLMAFIFFLFLLAPAPTIQSSDVDITPTLSRNVINRLREKYIPMFKKYKGIESNRQVETQTYDSKSNKLLSTAHVHVIRKDYFYKEPEIKVLKYIVDGKEEKTSKYKPIKSQPGYQVFDENGDKNYETRIVGYKIVEDQNCYQVNVTPKKATKLHYKGMLYYRVSDLKLVKSSGSIGEISFPLKELHIDLYTDDLNDLTVISSGVITARVNIPVILPDRRIVSRFKALNNKPIL